MAKPISLIGTIVFEKLEGGFWGIIDEKGNKWQPVTMPEQLKHVGKKVSVVVKPVDVMGISMWGQPVKIISFGTLAP